MDLITVKRKPDGPHANKPKYDWPTPMDEDMQRELEF